MIVCIKGDSNNTWYFQPVLQVPKQQNTSKNQSTMAESYSLKISLTILMPDSKTARERSFTPALPPIS